MIVAVVSANFIGARTGGRTDGEGRKRRADGSPQGGKRQADRGDVEAPSARDQTAASKEDPKTGGGSRGWAIARGFRGVEPFAYLRDVLERIVRCSPGPGKPHKLRPLSTPEGVALRPRLRTTDVGHGMANSRGVRSDSIVRISLSV